MDRERSFVDDYQAAGQYVISLKPARKLIGRPARANAWSRGDWPVAIPILVCWAYLGAFAVYQWVLMLTVHDVPAGYLLTPIVMILLFGGPAILPWMYDPSAFTWTALFYSFVIIHRLTDSEPNTAWDIANLVVYGGVIAAAWLSQKRVGGTIESS